MPLLLAYECIDYAAAVIAAIFADIKTQLLLPSIKG